MELKNQQPPLSVEEQIQNLKDKNLSFEDENYAASLLSDISYFRLIKAYSLGLKPKNGLYNDGVTFEQIVDLYKFNCHLRQEIFLILSSRIKTAAPYRFGAGAVITDIIVGFFTNWNFSSLNTMTLGDMSI